MAIIRSRNNIIYIQWYDPITKKIQAKSTGLRDTDTNRKKTKKIAKVFQAELSGQNEKLKLMGIRDITIHDAFKHLLKNNQKKHPKTIKDYERFYKKFTEYFDENLPCTSLTKLNIEDWLIDIQKLPLAQNSIHAYGKQLIHFLNFLFEYNYTTMFKINREVKTKPEIKEIIVFSDHDLETIFKFLKEKNSNFKTTIFILFYTGLRPTDILTITCDKIDLENRTLKYYSPKRKKHREIAFHKDLVPILKARMSEVKAKQIIHYKNVENLGKAINRYMEQIHLKDKGYTARTFRKTFITLCRSRYNMDASVVRELIGHEHGNTMDRFYNQISLSRMKKEIDMFKRPF